MALIELAKVVFCLQLLWFASINCKHDHPIPTYFGRVHPNGTIVDARNPENRLKLNFPPKPTRPDPGAVLKVSPSSNIDNGAEVTVMWSGVSSPSAKDVVILYCPPDAEPDHYLDFIYVSSISSYTKGYGEFAVRLWNLRKECQFGYYRNDNYTLVVAKSEILTFKGGAEIPLQGHLALTGNPTEMRVMWVSGSSKFIAPGIYWRVPYPCFHVKRIGGYVHTVLYEPREANVAFCAKWEFFFSPCLALRYRFALHAKCCVRFTWLINHLLCRLYIP